MCSFFFKWFTFLFFAAIRNHRDGAGLGPRGCSPAEDFPRGARTQTDPSGRSRSRRLDGEAPRLGTGTRGTTGREYGGIIFFV